MRPVVHADVVTAARALLAAPEEARAGLAARLIAEAGAADRWRLRTGRRHPLWGNGTLAAAAHRRALAREPALDDRDYCACLLRIFAALLARGG